MLFKHDGETIAALAPRCLKTICSVLGIRPDAHNKAAGALLQSKSKGI